MTALQSELTHHPGQRPLKALWHQFAVISLTFALITGFGAYAQLFTLTPLTYVVVQVPLLLATLLICPPGLLTKVFLPITGLLFVGWWLLSYLWDANRAIWIKFSLHDLTMILAIVVLAQVLGKDGFLRCLLHSGYIAIGLIFFALVIQPDLAYQLADNAPGLRGGFLHKNLMAPVLLLTAAVVLSMHPSRSFRRWFVVFIAVLLFLAQTTTGLATLAALVLCNWALASYKSVVRRLGRSAGSLLVGATMVATLVAATMFSSLVLLSGKDLTFSNRTVIWDAVGNAINQRFWLGYGYAVWANLWLEPIRSINMRNGFVVAHAHNAALDLMLRLGAVGLGLYLLQFFNTARAGWRALVRDDALGRLILLYCTMLVLVGFSEPFPGFGLWVGLLIAFASISRANRTATSGTEP